MNTARTTNAPEPGQTTLTVWPVVAYGALGLPLAFAALPIYVHLPRLYSEFVGLPLALLGTVLLLARLADALVDPWLGTLSDRPGWRRPIICLSIGPLMVGLAALFNPGPDAGLIWLIVSLTLTYLAFSLLSVAYAAWGAELGRDLGERTRLTSSREGWGLVGVISAAVLPALLAKEFDVGLARWSWSFPALMVITALATYWAGNQLARRQPLADLDRPAPRPTDSASQSLRLAIADRPLRHLLLIFLANGLASALPATLVMFYVAHVLAAEHLAGAFLALYFVSALIGLPLWIARARQVGPLVAWRQGMWIAAAGFIVAPFLGAGDLWPFALLCIVTGLALGSDLALPAAVLAQLTDARRPHAPTAGSAFGLWNLVAKLSLALAAGIALPLLELSGFVAGQSNGALALLYGGLPLFGKLLAIALLSHWSGNLSHALSLAQSPPTLPTLSAR